MFYSGNPASSYSSLMSFNRWLGLIGWLAAAYTAAAIGAVASISAAQFYADLVRPSWAPPGWVFGPVWSVLYSCMGIASWLVWRTQSEKVPRALALYLVQLAFNALWSWLFFAWHQGRWASIEIVVLWVLLALTLGSFWRVRPAAGILLLPYFLWVSFAVALAFTTWRLNPQLLS
jgi:benzodiazapine receptor